MLDVKAMKQCVSKADTQCTQLLMNSFCFHSNQLHLSDAVFSDALQVNASAAHNACFFVSPPPLSLKAHGAGRYQANTCPRVNGFSKLCEMTHFYTHMSSSSALLWSLPVRNTFFVWCCLSDSSLRKKKDGHFTDNRRFLWNATLLCCTVLFHFLHLPFKCVLCYLFYYQQQFHSTKPASMFIIKTSGKINMADSSYR